MGRAQNNVRLGVSWCNDHAELGLHAGGDEATVGAGAPARRCGAAPRFFEVQTPVFESLELFTAKSGPGVINQLYAFQDKGERDLTLRPELTAPVMRMVAEEMRMDTKPLRLSYYGQCYRYEEFKTGRYREFFQYGVELIGASGPLAEAEVLALAVNMLHATGLEGWEIRIGHVGVLKDALTGLGLSSEVDASTGEPPIASAMRLLDKGDDEVDSSPRRP